MDHAIAVMLLTAVVCGVVMPRIGFAVLVILVITEWERFG